MVVKKTDDGNQICIRFYTEEGQKNAQLIRLSTPLREAVHGAVMNRPATAAATVLLGFLKSFLKEGD